MSIEEIEETNDQTFDQLPITHIWIGDLDLMQREDVKILGQNLSDEAVGIYDLLADETLYNHDSLLQYRWGFKIITANNADQDAWLSFANKTILTQDPSQLINPVVQFNDGCKYKCLTMGYNENPFMVMLITVPFTSKFTKD
jgi:hypothetical protein